MRLIFMLVALTLPFGVFAQVKFSASVDQTAVQQNQRIQYTLTLENGNGTVTPPAFPGFQFEGGPTTQYSSTFINGQSSSSMSYVYYIRARDLGTFTIAPAKANVNGQTYQSNAIQISISKGAPAPQVTGNAGEVFGRIQLSADKAFLGEPLTATYWLYSRHGNLQLQEIKFADVAGFWKEEIKTGQTSWDPNTEVISGMRYQKAILRKEVLFPQKTGVTEFGAFTMKAMVGGTWFSQGKTVNGFSNSVKVTVNPLPAPQPANFSGAVGSYDFQVVTDKTELAVDEALNLKLTISGSGNLKLIDAEKINFPADFEVYDPKISENFSAGPSGLTGTRISEYTAIPRHHGDFRIGPVQFCYFDLASKSYRTKGMDSIVLKVEKGRSAESPGIQTFARKDVEILDSDIRFILTNAEDLKPKGKEFFASWAWFAGLSFPLLSLAAFILFFSKYEKMRTDVVTAKRRKAMRVAGRHLRAAAAAKAEGNRSGFFEAISIALYGYFADKLSIPVSELGRQQIGEQLKTADVSESRIDESLKLIDDCDMARFSPEGSVNPDSVMDRAEKLISAIEEEALK